MTAGRRLVYVTTLIASMASAPLARADERILQLGGGIAFDALGSYDLGAELGGASRHSDLGPGTLGAVLQAGVLVTRDLTLGGEARIAVGGLVGTDERYFGTREQIGSTLSVDAKLNVGWTAARRGPWAGQLGADIGIERMIESTGAGSVHLEAIVGGPWVGLALGHVVLQLRGDVHVPVHGLISDQASGDPRGAFYSGGVRLLYVFGVGPRIGPRIDPSVGPPAPPAPYTGPPGALP